MQLTQSVDQQFTSVTIKRCETSQKNCLKFSFSGSFKETDAALAATQWREYFSAHKGQKITLIWDCLKMTGYEPVARHIWQKELKLHKDQIENIWLVSESRAIRTGAMILSAFTSHNIKAVENESQIFLS